VCRRAVGRTVVAVHRQHLATGRVAGEPFCLKGDALPSEHMPAGGGELRCHVVPLEMTGGPLDGWMEGEGCVNEMGQSG
jgi:hypothetical protein